MEGRSRLLTSSALCSCPFTTSQHYSLPKPQLFAFKFNCYPNLPRLRFVLKTFKFCSSAPPRISFLLRPTSALVIDNQLLEKSDAPSLAQPTSSTSSSSSSKEMLPKIDKSGRFCSPRAARELALSILYAACLEGCDPVRLFEKRINVRWGSGYEFDRESLMQYNHMSFGGPPVTANTVAEADHLLLLYQKESEIEAEVLSAPPNFTRKLLVAVVEKWDNHVLVIDKVAPPNWKNDPAGRILELSILHLAMSEMAVVGTRHQIVINEAVDLAKRFCDGAAPRIINGCLRSFIKHVKGGSEVEGSS